MSALSTQGDRALRSQDLLNSASSKLRSQTAGFSKWYVCACVYVCGVHDFVCMLMCVVSMYVVDPYFTCFFSFATFRFRKQT